MNRTVCTTLRRGAGGSVIFAIGLGAFSSMPQQVSSASAAPISPLIVAAVTPETEPAPHRVRPTTMVIFEEAPPPAPAPAPAPSRPQPLFAKATVAMAPARAIGPVTGAANGFYYGYCTWWVAHKRYIPWRGNAAQWWWNARAFGYAEGQSPRPGAIMVMGVSGTSPDGHVGYVESVNGDGSFVVSEMNWWGVPGGGWGRVDYRTVTSMRGILGFIY